MHCSYDLYFRYSFILEPNFVWIQNYEKARHELIFQPLFQLFCFKTLNRLFLNKLNIMKRYIHNSMKLRRQYVWVRRQYVWGQGEQTKNTKATPGCRGFLTAAVPNSLNCAHYTTGLCRMLKRKSLSFFNSPHKCNHFEKGRFNFLLNGLHFNKSARGCRGDFLFLRCCQCGDRLWWQMWRWATYWQHRGELYVLEIVSIVNRKNGL